MCRGFHSWNPVLMRGKCTKPVGEVGDPNLDLGDDNLHNCQDQLAPVGIVPAIFYGMGTGWKTDRNGLEMVRTWFWQEKKWLHINKKWKKWRPHGDQNFWFLMNTRAFIGGHSVRGCSVPLRKKPTFSREVQSFMEKNQWISWLLRNEIELTRTSFENRFVWCLDGVSIRFIFYMYVFIYIVDLSEQNINESIVSISTEQYLTKSRNNFHTLLVLYLLLWKLDLLSYNT